LLIRPLGGTTALWGLFRDRLAEQFRVVSYDHPGCGRSPWHWCSTTTRGLARCALSVLDALGIARAHTFGISLGGMTATWLAVLHPTRIQSLCLASTPRRGIELNQAGLRRELGFAACFARGQKEVEPALVHRVLSQRFRDENPEGVASIERRVRAAPTCRRTLLGHGLAGLTHDAAAELHRIVAPTLVLAGEDDALLGVAPSRALAAAIPGADFDLVAASGHDLTLEQPEATARRVAAFFLPSSSSALLL
jgi:pimeloyl-ACP methyl ester carboxylesterase